MRFQFLDINRTASSSIRRALGLTDTPRHRTFLHLGEKEREAFVFSWVRHPFRRILSEWKHRHAFHKGMEFDRWVVENYRHPSGETRPDEPYSRRLLWPQTRWLCDEDGGIDLDFIGRFERLSEDWARLQDHLGVEASLPHTNRASDRRRFEKTCSSQQVVEILAVAFREDLETFGYEAITAC